jgi:hypothetical protein
MANGYYQPGGWYRICDCCGLQYRNHETRKRWDGAIVCRACWEPRHPQDMVKGRADRQNVPDPRPEPSASIIGPLTTTVTATANAGATSVSVESSARFEAGDHVGIALDGGTIHRVIVTSVPNATSIAFTAHALPGPTSDDAVVINYTAVSEPDLG